MASKYKNKILFHHIISKLKFLSICSLALQHPHVKVLHIFKAVTKTIVSVMSINKMMN